VGDRDEPPGAFGDRAAPQLGGDAGYFPRRWRRRYIESYLIWPPAIAAAAGVSEPEVVKELRDRHGIAVGPHFTDSDPPQALLDTGAVCADIKTVLADVERRA
jgi:hypothetical protein